MSKIAVMSNEGLKECGSKLMLSEEDAPASGGNISSFHISYMN